LKKTCSFLITMLFLLVGYPAMAMDTGSFGIETDYLAFRIGESGSYLITGWYAKDNIKYSLTYAAIDVTKEHETHENADSESNIIAFRVDCYRNDDLKGLWFGGAVVYEQQELVYNNKTGKINSISAGITCGYSFYVSDNFYIAPYVNALAPIGKHECVIDGKTFKNASWSLEPGIKIGVQF